MVYMISRLIQVYPLLELLTEHINFYIPSLFPSPLCWVEAVSMLSLLFFSIYLHFSSVVLTPAQYGFFAWFFLALVINILNFHVID